MRTFQAPGGGDGSIPRSADRSPAGPVSSTTPIMLVFWNRDVASSSRIRAPRAQGWRRSFMATRRRAPKRIQNADSPPRWRRAVDCRWLRGHATAFVCCSRRSACPSAGVGSDGRPPLYPLAHPSRGEAHPVTLVAPRCRNCGPAARGWRRARPGQAHRASPPPWHRPWPDRTACRRTRRAADRPRR